MAKCVSDCQKKARTFLCLAPVLQPIRGNWDDFRDNYPYFSVKHMYVLTHHYSCLGETVLMRGHSIFSQRNRNIICNTSFLSGALLHYELYDLEII